jgi:outer membrane protein
MKVLRCGWLILMWCCGQVAQAGAQAGVQAGVQTGVQDLMQVYAQARAADPLLAQADAQRGLQQEAAVRAGAALLPQWSLNASHSRLKDSHSSTLSSNLSQVVFDLGKLREWDATQTLLSAQEASLRTAEQALCARVATAYFAVLSAQASLQTADAIAAAYEREWQAAQQRLRAGLAAAVDMEQSRTYFELARGTVVQAQVQWADARQALAQITGQEPGALKPLADRLLAQAPQPPDAAAWAARALAVNPQLQALALSLSAGETAPASSACGGLSQLQPGCRQRTQPRRWAQHHHDDTNPSCVADELALVFRWRVGRAKAPGQFATRLGPRTT